MWPKDEETPPEGQRCRNAFHRLLPLSPQTSRSASRQKSNTATLPKNIIMSSAPTLATNVVTVRNAGQLAEAVEEGSLCELRHQSSANRNAARASKTMVMGAMSRGGEVRLKVDKRPTKKAIHSFLTSAVDNDASALYTDEHSAYVGWADGDTPHEHVTHRN